MLKIKPSRNEISNDIRQGSTCDRCTISLVNSIHKGVACAFSLNQKNMNGWLCVRCSTTPSEHGNRKLWTSIQEFDIFVDWYLMRDKMRAKTLKNSMNI